MRFCVFDAKFGIQNRHAKYKKLWKQISLTATTQKTPIFQELKVPLICILKPNPASVFM